MNTAIDPTVLKTLRKARKIGRPKLAKISGLTERQLMRIEGGDIQTPLAPATGERLSDALQVPFAVLTGELELIDADLQPAKKSSCTSGCCG